MAISLIIHILPWVALIGALVYLPIYLLAQKRRGKQSLLYHLVRYALICYCMGLVYLTLLWYYPDITFSPEYYFLNLQPFVWLSQTYDMGVGRMLEQLLLNIGMFVPLGLLLPMVFRGLRRVWKTAVVVLCTTLAVETLQYFMGRSADIDDVIMTLLGGLVGYCLFALLNRLFRQKSPWNRLLGSAKAHLTADE